MSTVQVKVQDQKGIIWEGEGHSCSLVNSLGVFDILPEHTQFISPITDTITVRKDQKIIWQYQLPSSAICRVKSNQIEVWVGI